MKEQLTSDRFTYFGHLDLRGKGIHRITIENRRTGITDFYSIEKLLCLICDPENAMLIVSSIREDKIFLTRYFIDKINYRETYRRKHPAVRAAERYLKNGQSI